MAKFIQIIEYKTSKIDDVVAVGDEWVAATEGKRTADPWCPRAEDRDEPGHATSRSSSSRPTTTAMKNNEPARDAGDRSQDG